MAVVPIAVEWDEESRLWRLVTGAAFGFDEIVELVEKTDWRASKRYLWDFRDLRSGPGKSEDLHNGVDLLELNRALWAGSRAALLVERDIDFGIARMFQALAEGMGVEYQVFRDEQTARAWLEVAPAE